MSHLSRRSFGHLVALAMASATVASIASADGHATTHTVRITQFAFEPAQLTINAGDTVVFVNEDGAPHTATANNGGFNTGSLRRGAQASLTFNAAGTFDYFCEIHPKMKASLIVQ